MERRSLSFPVFFLVRYLLASWPTLFVLFRGGSGESRYTIATRHRVLKPPHRLDAYAVEDVHVDLLGKRGRAMPHLIGDVAQILALGV